MPFSFGKNIKVTLSGSSHAKQLAVKINGLPADFSPDENELKSFLKRRSPTSFSLATSRKEDDDFTIISHRPFKAIIKNKDVRTSDYDPNILRPSHADWTAKMKYGVDYDCRGGSVFSGRMTAPLCLAGGICKQLLAERNIFIGAHIFSIGNVKDDAFDMMNIAKETLLKVASQTPSILNPESAAKMLSLLSETKEQGDSIGGIIECAIIGTPTGLGGPLFDGLESALSAAIFAIPAVKGIEFGTGFASAKMTGSQNNDALYTDGKNILTKSNRHGGILGGISSGNPIVFKVAFKPTPSIAKKQDSVNISTMENVSLNIRGRHDPCIALRSAPIVESAAAIVILDTLLGQEINLLKRGKNAK